MSRTLEVPEGDAARPLSDIRIGGFTPLTTIDFPGHLAAVVFCQGCPWNCGYCHNPHLLSPASPPVHSWARVSDFLTRRKGLLDGVVFSGGEPTLQAMLAQALAAVRAMGFKTALHTAGMYPERLASSVPLLDWVGFDVKGPWSRYDDITRAPRSADRVMRSLDLLIESKVDIEVRTTWSPTCFGEAELQSVGHDLAARGVTNWVIRPQREVGRTAPAAFAPPRLVDIPSLHIQLRGFES